MDFNLSEEQRMLQTMVKEFTEREIEPIAAEMDKEGKVSDDLIKKYAEIGLLGMTVPKEYDGNEAGGFAHLLAIEQLAYAGAPAWWPVAFNNSLPETICHWGTPEQKGRSRYYHWLRQNGLWTREVSGFDPDTQRVKLDPYCPVRNVTAAYPPIVMIHGTDDKDVPYEQSAAMARQLARHRVPHELITIRNAGHGLGGGDKKQVADAHARAMTFMKRHLE